MFSIYFEHLLYNIVLYCIFSRFDQERHGYVIMAVNHSNMNTDSDYNNNPRQQDQYSRQLYDAIYFSIPYSVLEKYIEVVQDDSLVDDIPTSEDTPIQLDTKLHSLMFDKISECMETLLKGNTKPEDVKPIVKQFLNKYSKKKNYVYTSTLKKLQSHRIDDPKSLVYTDYIYYSNLSPRERREKGIVLDLKIEVTDRFTNKLVDWKESKSGFLSTCPAYKSYTHKKKSEAVEADINYIICKYVDTVLNCDIDSYIHIYPEKILQVPIFSLESSIVNTNYSSLDDIEKIAATDDAEKAYYLSSNKSVNVQQTLDTYDSALLRTIVSLFGPLVYEKESILTVPAQKLITRFWPKKTTDGIHKADYERVKEHITKIHSASLAITDDEEYEDRGKRFALLNFLDVAIYNPDDDTYTFRLSPSYREMLVSKNVVRVVESDLIKLTDNMSRQILFPLQQKRIQCCFSGKYEDELDYDYLCSIVNFSGNAPRRATDSIKKRNVKAVYMVLQRIMNANVCIDSLELIDDLLIKVKYKPLSESEIKDLEFYHNNAND